jgi:uncharacterized protein (TIGR03066 family)
MTQFSRKAIKIKNKHRPGDAAGPNGAAGPAKSAAPRRWLPGWAVALLYVSLAGLATFVVFEYFILSKVPRDLLGKWVVAEGELEGATLEFFRDGTMTLKLSKEGKQFATTASVRTEDKTLYSTTTNPMTGKKETASQTIVSLTDTRCVLEDEKGTVLNLERAH